MKIGSILVLFALIVSVILPLHPVVSHASDKGKAMLLTLDVCDKVGQSLSSNADMVSIHECQSKFIPLEFYGFQRISNPAFSSSLISFQKERPPRV